MASKRPKGLGRGLEALLGGADIEAESIPGTSSTIPMAQLQAGTIPAAYAYG